MGKRNSVRIFSAFFVVLVQIFLPIVPAFADEVSSGNDSPPSSDLSGPVTESSSDAGSTDERESSDEEEVSKENDDTTSSEEEEVVKEIVPPLPPDDADGGDDALTHDEDEEGDELPPPLISYGDDGLVMPEDGSEVGADGGEEELSDTEDDIPGDTSPQVIPLPEDDAVLSLEDENAPLDEGTSTVDTVPVEEAVLPQQEEYHYVVSDDTHYTFGRNDCVRVADGSYYCSHGQATTTLNSDRVFSGPDRDGDSEIFFGHGGEIAQITHNSVDDAAPFYDPASETLVWHRLLDARYQIISLDLASGEESKLTNDNFNNMQPSRHGDVIVWQGWVGNDWEIFLKEGDAVSMLTDNTVHDIGPSINSDFIIWQSEEKEGWKVRVYNMKTGRTDTIDEASGASVENPRLMLVYDAKQENGDVETRGYDLMTGKKVPLHAESLPVPEKIPEPDQTGEKRALITSTQLKVKADEDDEGTTTPTLTGGDDGITPVPEDDLIIPPYESSTSTDTVDEATESVTDDVEEEVDGNTLILSEYISDESDISSVIPDLLVPPFEQIHTEADPQSLVAE